MFVVLGRSSEWSSNRRGNALLRLRTPSPLDHDPCREAGTYRRVLDQTRPVTCTQNHYRWRRTTWVEWWWEKTSGCCHWIVESSSSSVFGWTDVGRKFLHILSLNYPWINLIDRVWTRWQRLPCVNSCVTLLIPVNARWSPPSTNRKVPSLTCLTIWFFWNLVVSFTTVRPNMYWTFSLKLDSSVILYIYI